MSKLPIKNCLSRGKQKAPAEHLASETERAFFAQGVCIQLTPLKIAVKPTK